MSFYDQSDGPSFFLKEEEPASAPLSYRIARTAASIISPRRQPDGEFAPEPQQQLYAVGKLLYWGQDRAGKWTGVITAGGYRWIFGARDTLCTELAEGMTVSFRSRLLEDFRGLGVADQVAPYEASQPRQQLPWSQPEPQPERPLPAQESPEELYGIIEFYGDEMASGLLSADGIKYSFGQIDIIKGVPSTGAFARFRAVAGDGPSELQRAVSVEIA